MKARLHGGPGAAEIVTVPDRPPAHIDVVIAIEDFAEVAEAAEYLRPPTFETHRYVLASLNSHPNGPGPRYSHLQKLLS
jgi:hypothetical protein